MKHCGVVTDATFYLESNLDKIDPDLVSIPERTDEDSLNAYKSHLRRIYSDEVPMADINTILRIKNRRLWERDKLASIGRRFFDDLFKCQFPFSLMK